MMPLLPNSHAEYLPEFQYILSLISHSHELCDHQINLCEWWIQIPEPLVWLCIIRINQKQVYS